MSFIDSDILYIDAVLTVFVFDRMNSIEFLFLKQERLPSKTAKLFIINYQKEQYYI